MIDESGSEFFEGETSDCVWLVAAVSSSKERLATVVWRVATVIPSEERLATAIWRVAAVSLFGRETGNCDLELALTIPQEVKSFPPCLHLARKGSSWDRFLTTCLW